MTKKYFLKCAYIVGGFILIFIIAHNAYARTAQEDRAAKETYIPDLKLYPTNDILRQRGIEIAYVVDGVSPGSGRYYCGGMNQTQIEKAAAITTAVVEKIPAAAWHNIDLKYILLCSEAKSRGRIIGGIPVPPIKLLLLATGERPDSGSRFPYTILHELYHLIEMQNNSYNNREWDNRFDGYFNAYNDQTNSTRLGSGGKGFINAYGRSFSHEERAELFAIHVLSATVLQDYIQQNNDQILQEKLNFIRQSCPSLIGIRC